MAEKTALLLDGGFVKKKLGNTLHRFPVAKDIVDMCDDILKKPRLAGASLFRVYYYDAPPYDGKGWNPVDRSELDFSQTPQSAQNKALLDALELQPDFAVRKGAILHTGWKLGTRALKDLSRTPRAVTANDFVPDMQQKGVDLRIGLDMATISLKRTVDLVVLVTGDSDMVPAMKFARKEGLRVYLEALGHGVRRELKVHADFVL